MRVDLDACYSIREGHRLQWEEMRHAWVILYPEGMVMLNESAAATLQRCDGATPLRAVIADLEKVYGAAGLETDVRELIAAALADGWLMRSSLAAGMNIDAPADEDTPVEPTRGGERS